MNCESDDPMVTLFTASFTGSQNGACAGDNARGGSSRVGNMARGRTPAVEVNSRCFPTGDYYRGSEATVQVAGGDNCVREGKVRCNSGVGATGCYQGKLDVGERVCWCAILEQVRLECVD